MKGSKLIIVLLVALFAGIAWGVNHQHVNSRQMDYTLFSRGENGVSLLYDTLRHMRLPMGILYRPVGDSVSVNDVVFIIQPSNPRPSAEMAEEVLLWVQRGGRLIYLENSHPNMIDRILRGEYYRPLGSLRWYQLGMGEIVTGRANSVINANLMKDPTYGEGIAYLLQEWNPGRIYFAEYYHGFHRVEGAFGQMPPWLQLLALQIIIGAAVLIWHLGKRFGFPSPSYEELEREENEQVFTLARLYKQGRN